jgi:hypothetical protein
VTVLLEEEADRAAVPAQHFDDLRLGAAVGTPEERRPGGEGKMNNEAAFAAFLKEPISFPGERPATGSN